MNDSILFANGCSHTYGEDAIESVNPHDWIDNSIPAYLASMLDKSLINYALPGGSNYRIVRTTKTYIDNYIANNFDISKLFVLVGWTESNRFELELNNQEFINYNIEIYKKVSSVYDASGIYSDTEFLKKNIQNKPVLPYYALDIPPQYLAKTFIKPIHNTVDIDIHFKKNIIQILPESWYNSQFHYEYMKKHFPNISNDINNILNFKINDNNSIYNLMYDLQEYLNSRGIKYLFFQTISNDNVNIKDKWNDIKDVSWPSMAETLEEFNTLHSDIKEEIEQDFVIIYNEILQQLSKINTISINEMNFYNYELASMYEELIMKGFNTTETSHFRKDAYEAYASSLYNFGVTNKIF